MDITGWISGFWSQIADWATSILAIAFAGLPDSPFVMISKNSEISNLVGYVNWVIPIDFMIATLELWLVAVGIFYVYRKAYSAEIAQKNYDHLATSKGVQLKIAKDFKLVEFIEEKILSGWSPDVVVGYIKKENLKYTRICTSTLYSYIDKGIFLNISNKNLLVKSTMKKNTYKKVRLHKINLKGTSIDNRANTINERIEKGHWEMDTVIGTRDGKSTCLLVLSERVTRQELIFKIKEKTQFCVCRALDKLERLHGSNSSKIFKSITVDNGTENLDFNSIEKSIYKKSKRTQVFYCHPYSSWERGTNENTNKLIRRFIPKGTDISKYTEKQIKYIENWINNYPRKILGYFSSGELFTQYLQNIGA